MDTEIILIFMDKQLGLKSENSMKYKLWNMDHVWWSHNRMKSPSPGESMLNWKGLFWHTITRGLGGGFFVNMVWQTSPCANDPNCRSNVEYLVCHKVESINVKRTTSVNTTEWINMNEKLSVWWFKWELDTQLPDSLQFRIIM